MNYRKVIPYRMKSTAFEGVFIYGDSQGINNWNLGGMREKAYRLN